MSSQLFVAPYTLTICPSAHKQLRLHLPTPFREFLCITSKETRINRNNKHSGINDSQIMDLRILRKKLLKCHQKSIQTLLCRRKKTSDIIYHIEYFQRGQVQSSQPWGRVTQPAKIREDTHKKSIFFSGRTTKGVGRVNPPTSKQKNTFFL